jgi:ubiquitin C-terminal hydrolase
MQGPDGVEINMGRVSSTGKVKVISKNGEVANFMPTAVIQHSGQVIRGGDSRGHYTCDVLSRENDWWHTNDKQQPKKINRQKVSKHATTVLYKRIT